MFLFILYLFFSPTPLQCLSSFLVYLLDLIKSQVTLECRLMPWMPFGRVMPHQDRLLNVAVEILYALNVKALHKRISTEIRKHFRPRATLLPLVVQRQKKRLKRAKWYLRWNSLALWSPEAGLIRSTGGNKKRENHQGHSSCVDERASTKVPMGHVANKSKGYAYAWALWSPLACSIPGRWMISRI